MNKKAVSLLALIVLISGAISFSLLTRGHSWLDDFAAYIMQAKAFVDGSMGEFVRRNAFPPTPQARRHTLGAFPCCWPRSMPSLA